MSYIRRRLFNLMGEPLWETVNGVRYPTWACAYCGGGF
jgi:hypothetical protein